MNRIGSWKRSLAFFLNIALAVGVVGTIHLAGEPEPAQAAVYTAGEDEASPSTIRCMSFEVQAMTAAVDAPHLNSSTPGAHGATTVEIQLACGARGGGFSGQIGGKRIALPKTSKETGGIYSSKKYGKPGKGKIDKKTKKRTDEQIRKFAKKYKVPVPKKDHKMSKTAKYRVYQIYAVRTTNSGATYYQTFKYGITKVGRSRPQSQISKCQEQLVVEQCVRKWVRKDVTGWYRARTIEALYATRYKKRLGGCPPGMKRCL